MDCVIFGRVVLDSAVTVHDALSSLLDFCPARERLPWLVYVFQKRQHHAKATFALLRDTFILF